MIARTVFVLTVFILAIAGCAQTEELADVFYEGQFGKARDILEARAYVQAQRRDGINNMLHDMRLTLVDLADGYAAANDARIDSIFTVLRTQGLNADKTVDVLVTNGHNRIWKGDPFEQALSFHYIGVHFAMMGSWDNARAAEQGSLFALKDHSGAAGRAGYVARDTNFVLGYLMSALANQELSIRDGDPNRRKEADDYYRRAIQLNPALSDLVAQLGAGNYNTVLVVDFGHGPKKTGIGVDKEQLEYRDATMTTNGKLKVTVDGSPHSYPLVCDVNLMAKDEMWNAFEGLRLAKTIVANMFLIPGTGAADTRYCEMMPQRVYVVPVTIDGPGTKIELEVEGAPQSRMVLAGMDRARGPDAQLRYVRLVTNRDGRGAWGGLAAVLYTNDCASGIFGKHGEYPYILGGSDVRLPTDAVMQSYHQMGILRDMDINALKDLYRREGITMSLQDQGGVPRAHVLEGGSSLVAPLPGTAGFKRLFCNIHPPYKRKSEEARAWAERVKRELQQVRPK